MKNCSHCKVEKEEKDFYKEKKKDGLQSYCKSCCGKSSKKSRDLKKGKFYNNY